MLCYTAALITSCFMIRVIVHQLGPIPIDSPVTFCISTYRSSSFCASLFLHQSLLILSQALCKPSINEWNEQINNFPFCVTTSHCLSAVRFSWNFLPARDILCHCVSTNHLLWLSIVIRQTLELINKRLYWGTFWETKRSAHWLCRSLLLPSSNWTDLNTNRARNFCHRIFTNHYFLSQFFAPTLCFHIVFSTNDILHCRSITISITAFAQNPIFHIVFSTSDILRCRSITISITAFAQNLFSI